MTHGQYGPTADYGDDSKPFEIAPPVVTVNAETITVQCPDCSFHAVSLRPQEPDSDLAHVCSVDGKQVHRVGALAWPLDG